MDYWQVRGDELILIRLLDMVLPDGWLYDMKFQKTWGKLRVRLGLVFTIVLLVLADKPLFYPALIISLVGIALRIYSAGIIKKNRVLAMDGPYLLCRHPLYLGSFLLGLGLVIMTRQWFMLALYLVFFAFIYGIEILFEERKLKDAFPDAYPTYNALVPAFFPKLSNLGKLSFDSFDRKLLAKNRELKHLLGFLLMITCFILRAHYF